MSKLLIRSMKSAAEARACARIMAASEPWITLGRDYDACLAIVSNQRRERYVACQGGRFAGFLVLDMQGAFVGYIQTVCVAPDCRNRGVGTRLVRFAEERIYRDSPNVFLCVSSFNARARQLYERLGYRVVGALSNYLIRDKSELLLRKSRGPINGYRRMRPQTGVPARPAGGGSMRQRKAPAANGKRGRG